MAPTLLLGPLVERLEKGYPLFSVVYFSRRTLPQKLVKGDLGFLAPCLKVIPNCPRRSPASLARVLLGKSRYPSCPAPNGSLAGCQVGSLDTNGQITHYPKWVCPKSNFLFCARDFPRCPPPATSSSGSRGPFPMPSAGQTGGSAPRGDFHKFAARGFPLSNKPVQTTLKSKGGEYNHPLTFVYLSSFIIQIGSTILFSWGCEP